MKKALILAVIIGLIIGIPLAQKYFKSDQIIKVIIEPAAEHMIKASVLASGQLKHEHEVKLSAEVIGKVSRLSVIEGDSVTKNQLVLEIDDQSYVAAVQQQQAAVDQQIVAIERQKLVVSNTQKQWKRKNQLFNQNLLDRDHFENITHQLELSKVDLKSSFEVLKQFEAKLEQTKEQLAKTKVRSPINGKITSLDIKQGETAISGTTNIAGSSLMTIADPDSMLAEINIDEADIANVKIGQQAEIIAIAFDNKPIQGTVESIASSAKSAPGRQTLSFAVKLRLNQGVESNLRPGMSCRAEVFTQGEQSLLSVPVKAIQTVEDNDNDLVENFVFIFDGEKAQKIKVQTGISDDSYQQIISGIDAGMQVITGPDKILRHLNNEDKVISEASDPATNADE